jgi:hypothetical protein
MTATSNATGTMKKTPNSNKQGALAKERSALLVSLKKRGKKDARDAIAALRDELVELDGLDEASEEWGERASDLEARFFVHSSEVVVEPRPASCDLVLVYESDDLQCGNDLDEFRPSFVQAGYERTIPRPNRGSGRGAARTSRSRSADHREGLRAWRQPWP